MKKAILWSAALLVSLSVAVWSGRDAFADDLDADLDELWETRELPARMGEPVVSVAGKFAVGLQIGVIPNDDYFTYVPFSIDAYYRFTEMWGLMARGSILMAHADTVLSDFMDRHAESRVYAEEQRGDFTVAATFHPVYGKATVGTQNLWRFDWGVFAGLGVVASDSPNDARTGTSVEAYAEGILGTDFDVYFLDWLAVRLEASMRIYKARTQWMVPCTLSAGVVFVLPWGGRK